ncbi:MAG: SgcJ/EcaC family oxidoreductase [Deltaproteobacteria bacterium]|nr:SgcJ/EcaC family oxidoreductase [Deltaproteobacteria bacterium]
MHATTPEDVDRLFGERVNAGDLDGLVALYEPDATLVTQDAGTLQGHAAIREYLSGLTAMKATIDMGALRVVPAGRDLAVVHHDWRATLTTPDGRQTPLTGKATEIVRRQSDGRWLFALDDPDMRG